MHEKIEELLVDWEIARQENVPRSPEELCAECPELLEEFRAEIKRLNETSWLFEGQTRTPDLEPVAKKTAEQFLESLSESDLLSTQELAALKVDSLNQSAAELAESLKQSGKLTPYQADVFLGIKLGPIRLDRYLVLDEIGSGGMGQVYRAQHVSMKRDVAIKILAGQSQYSPSRRERFKREIESIAKLNHPNIVTAYDANEVDGKVFLAMEFVEGPNLAEQVRKAGPFDSDLAAKVTLQVAEAARFAHSHEIIHRDIKPANILLSKTGQAKLLDLGIAKTRTQSAAEPSDSSLTEAGGLFGTVAYMSPEHALEPSKSDARADIYSLGCTLFFLLTGHPPFESDNPVEVLVAHRETPVLQLLNDQGIEPTLLPVLEKMLAKDPADRFQSMDEVKLALQIHRDVDHVSNPVNSGSAKNRFRGLAIVLSIFALALMVPVAIWGYGKFDPSKAAVPTPDLTSKSYQNDLARWITNNGGIVGASTEFDFQELTSSSEVPEGPIEISEIQLSELAGEFSFEWLLNVGTLNRLVIQDSVLNEGDVPLLRQLSQIQELEIVECQMAPEIWQAIADLTQLTSLTVDTYDHTDHVVKNICKLKGLTALSLSNSDVTDQHAAILIDNFELLSLDLSGTSITSETLKIALQNKRLRNLYLANNEIDDADFQDLHTPSSLTKLNLDFCPVGSRMAKFVSKLQNLKELYVEGTNVGDEEVKVLGACPKLEHLDIAGTKVGNAGLLDLSAFSKLNSLSLANLPITESELLSLETLSLEYLDLSSTKITDDCFGPLAKLDGLLVLVVSDCSLSDEAIEGFLEQNTQCDVIQLVAE